MDLEEEDGEEEIQSRPPKQVPAEEGSKGRETGGQVVDEERDDSRPDPESPTPSVDGEEEEEGSSVSVGGEKRQRQRQEREEMEVDATGSSSQEARERQRQRSLSPISAALRSGRRERESSPPTGFVGSRREGEGEERREETGVSLSIWFFVFVFIWERLADSCRSSFVFFCV